MYAYAVMNVEDGEPGELIEVCSYLDDAMALCKELNKETEDHHCVAAVKISIDAWITG